MKSRILILCCVVLFLSTAHAASADQPVRLEQYGISFTVPDGLSWLPYQDASDDLKAAMDDSGACGMFMSSTIAYAQLVCSTVSDAPDTDFSVLSDHDILVYGQSLCEGLDASIFKGGVYNAGKTKWYQLTGSQSGSKMTIYITMKHGLFVSLASYNFFNLSNTLDASVEALLSSFTLPASPSPSAENLKTYILLAIGVCIGLMLAYIAKRNHKKHVWAYFLLGLIGNIFSLIIVCVFFAKKQNGYNDLRT